MNGRPPCPRNEALFAGLAPGEARIAPPDIAYSKIKDAARRRGLRILTVTLTDSATGERRRLLERLPDGASLPRALAELRRRRRLAIRVREIERETRFRPLTASEVRTIKKFHAGERIQSRESITFAGTGGEEA